MARKGSQARPVGVEDGATTVMAGMPVYLDQHPISHYEPMGHTGTAWIGLHRQYSSRQLAVVQTVYQTTASDIQRFVQLAHLHIARPIALYSTGAEMHVAHEYIELDLYDLLPLSETEVAAIMSQVCSIN
ncbi:hypothetical protein TrVFT333_000065 [Trichoderma virens FT-333]|nr:hypothetical protein TrVFT333_000065 [Trichoderma virens FT-333]